MTAAETPATRDQACPYLGLTDDRATHLAFPSTAQVCHALGRPTAADHVKQAQDCLTAEHVRCPRYHPVTEPAPAGRLLRDALAGAEGAGASTAASTTSIHAARVDHADRAGPERRTGHQGSAPGPGAPAAPAPPPGAARAVRHPAGRRRAGGLFIGSQLAEIGGTPGTSAPAGGTATATPSITVTPAPATTTPSIPPATVPAPTPTPSARLPGHRRPPRYGRRQRTS